MIIGDPKKVATIIVSRLGKQGDAAVAPEEAGGDEFHALAEDLLHAIETKSAAGVAEAVRALFLACESEPHEEADEDSTED